MPIDNVDVWSQYGLAGLVIAALFAEIWFLIRVHASERKEWLTVYKDHAERSDTRQSESNAVLRDLTAVIEVSNARRRGD